MVALLWRPRESDATESGALTNEAVELAVAVRFGSGGGWSSWYCCFPRRGSGEETTSEREMLVTRGTAGDGRGLTCGTSTWLDDVERADGLTGFGGGCFFANDVDEEDRTGIRRSLAVGVATRTGDEVALEERV